MSYRRADGMYAVGWIVERLRQLDQPGEEPLTFDDSLLRGGDSLDEELQRQLDECDLVLAVITPDWHGERADGSARIMDPADWIVRELRVALRQTLRPLNKRPKCVLPILVGGAEHPLPAQMHESIAGLTDRLSVPLADSDDLDRIVHDVVHHLANVDLERATLRGLDEPVKVPQFEQRGLIGATGVAVALILGWLGWLAARHGLCPKNESSCAFTGTTGAEWLRWLLPIIGLYVGAIAAPGVALTHRLRKLARVRWHALAATVGSALAAVIVVMLSIQQPSTGDDKDLVSYATLQVGVIVIGIAAVLPWAIALNAASTMRTRADDHEIADRIRFLGIVADAERWAAVILAVLVTGGVAIAVAVTRAFDEAGGTSSYRATTIVTLAVLVSALLVGSHLWNAARLAASRAELDQALAGVPAEYRDNANPQLMATSITEGSWLFRAFLSLPAIVAIAAVAVIEWT
jgi:hypothetical protein